MENEADDAIGAPQAIVDMRKDLEQPAKSAGVEALILAQSSLLLSRAVAYIELADVDCARMLIVEVRDHLDAINGYAVAKGIGAEFVEAQLSLMSVSGKVA